MRYQPPIYLLFDGNHQQLDEFVEFMERLVAFTGVDHKLFNEKLNKALEEAYEEGKFAGLERTYE
jgi:hypothetical protein